MCSFQRPRRREPWSSRETSALWTAAPTLRTSSSSSQDTLIMKHITQLPSHQAQGPGSRVQGPRSRVQGLGSRVQGACRSGSGPSSSGELEQHLSSTARLLVPSTHTSCFYLLNASFSADRETTIVIRDTSVMNNSMSTQESCGVQPLHLHSRTSLVLTCWVIYSFIVVCLGVNSVLIRRWLSFRESPAYVIVFFNVAQSGLWHQTVCSALQSWRLESKQSR